MTEDSRESYAYDWEDLDQVDQANKQIRAAQRIRAQAYHHVFVQDPLGAKILAEWVNSYCTGSPPLASASERECGMADGKREIVKLILDQIVKANGEEQ
jgi:hypothetical protein